MKSRLCDVLFSMKSRLCDVLFSMKSILLMIDDCGSMGQRKRFGSGSGKEMKSVDNKKSVDMD